MTDVFIKRKPYTQRQKCTKERQLMTPGRTSREDEGREWTKISTNQGTPKTASYSPEPRAEGWNRFPLTSLRRNAFC